MALFISGFVLGGFIAAVVWFMPIPDWYLRVLGIKKGVVSFEKCKAAYEKENRQLAAPEIMIARYFWDAGNTAGIFEAARERGVTK